MADKKKILVVLEELDIEIVQEQASLDGGNFSATLRRIIREWARVNATKNFVPGSTVTLYGEPEK